MNLSSLLSFFGYKGKSAKKIINHSSFRIHKKRKVDWRFKPNEGMMSKTVYTKYQIFHQNKLISFPEELGGSIWRTYILKDAPKPTLLVASKGIYLVSEENGQPKLSLIEKKSSDNTSVQWLDSENGQPGPKAEIFIQEDSTDCILSGGEFLLINEDTVLRISDLAVFPFTTKKLDRSADYYPGHVVAFSPNKEEVVFLGSKSHPEQRAKFIYALLIYHFQQDKVYPLPFDKTETRLYRPHTIASTWLNTYFEWQINEGQQWLSKRNLEQLPNWEGHFTKSSTYRLLPVKEEMHEVFLAFAKEFLTLKESDIKTRQYEGMKEYEIQHKGFVFNITQLSDLNSVSMSLSFMNKGSENDGLALLKTVGNAFNKKLKKGAHQSLFTSF